MIAVEPQLTQNQIDSVAHANARFNLYDGPMRSGKTVGSNNRWLKYLLQMDRHDYPGSGQLMIAGVTVGSALRNVVEPIREAIGESCRFISSQNTVEILGHKVKIFGGAKEDSEKYIRGMTLGGFLLDEVTLLHPKFFKQSLGRLSVKGAKGFGTTNPDGPKHWVKTDIIDNLIEKKYKRFQFPISGNTFLDPEYVESIKREFTGMWRARMIEGLWVGADGLVYEGFEDRPPMVLLTAPARAESYYISCDYGINNPAVFLAMARSGTRLYGVPRVWCEKEYVYSAGKDKTQRKTDKWLADALIDWAGPAILDNCRGIVVDPSALSFIEELKTRNLNVIPAVNEVVAGIQRQAKMLFSGEYAILSCCTQTIADYFLYTWDDKAASKGIDKPRKEDDHTKDAERYYFNTVEAGILDYETFLEE